MSNKSTVCVDRLADLKFYSKKSIKTNQLKIEKKEKAPLEDKKFRLIRIKKSEFEKLCVPISYTANQLSFVLFVVI